MLLSMTGHGDGVHQVDGIRAMAEVRSVNSRYFKLNIRSSEGLAGIESLAEKQIRERLRRGSVYLDLRLDGIATTAFRIKTQVLEDYRRQIKSLPGADASFDTLLRLPGVVEEQQPEQLEIDQIWTIVEPALKTALQHLDQMREAEGQAMYRDLVANCEQIRERLQIVEGRAPGVAEAYGERLTERINKLLQKHEISVQPGDLVREIGLIAERYDISEETVRLRSHLEQFLNVCRQNESNGRKLDFLTQEMFRETNTIGSKANDAQISQEVVEIKTLIERMREMIQNIE